MEIVNLNSNYSSDIGFKNSKNPTSFELNSDYKQEPITKANHSYVGKSTLSFLDEGGNVIELAISDDNLGRIKDKFKEDIFGADGNYFVGGEALEHFKGIWKYLTDKVEVFKADENRDGKYSVNEYSNLKENSINGINTSWRTLLDKEEIEEIQNSFDDSYSISLDQYFNQYLEDDQNLDGKLSEKEMNDNYLVHFDSTDKSKLDESYKHFMRMLLSAIFEKKLEESKSNFNELQQENKSQDKELKLEKENKKIVNLQQLLQTVEL